MTRRRTAAEACGIAGPVVFVGAFLLQDLLRPGVDPLGRYVSEYSLGTAGGVQIAAFVVSGALVAVSGTGLLRGGRRACGVLVTLIGLALAASGPVVTDPSTPGSPVTPHGVVHGVLGAVVFGLAPVTCLVEARRRGKSRSGRRALTAGVLLVVGIAALKVAQTPGTALFADRGLAQRIVLLLIMGWLVRLAGVDGPPGERGGGPASLPMHPLHPPSGDEKEQPR